MYIDEVTLHYYRAYKHEVVPIAKGLNVIYGDGDAGKSALVKGIAWVLLNAPQSKYINKTIKTPNGKIKSKEVVYVEVKFNTGNIIVRESDSTTPNIYRIGHVDTPREEWSEIKNFGNVVPDPVQQIINLNDLNFQKQFDPHFLLASKGGDVAKELNRMVDLEVIDTSTSKINKEVSSAKKKKESAEFSVKELSTDLNSYEYLNDVPDLLSKVEKIETQVTKKEDAIQKITDIVTKCRYVEKEIKSILPYIDAKTLCELYTALSDKIDSKVISFNKIEGWIAQAHQTEEQLKKVAHILSGKPLIESFTLVTTELDTVERQKSALDRIVTDLKKSNTTIARMSKVLDHRVLADTALNLAVEIKDKSKVFDYLGDLCDQIILNNEDMETIRKNIRAWKKEIGDVCPYCGNKLKEGDLCGSY